MIPHHQMVADYLASLPKADTATRECPDLVDLADWVVGLARKLDPTVHDRREVVKVIRQWADRQTGVEVDFEDGALREDE